MGPYIVAGIALCGTLITAGLALWGQARARTFAARGEAEAVLRKYREPLVGAAYELQGRLYNILELDFLRKYLVAGNEDQRTYAVENTLYVVAQYLGWTEILRREIQFLSFSDSEQTLAAASCSGRIVAVLQSDDPSMGEPFLLWRGEQRAIGELMIESDGGQARCIGYASFLKRRDAEFRRWFERLERQIPIVAEQPNRRLVELQHALVDLIRLLDPQGIRYPPEQLHKVGDLPG